jgi:hypothetical protein
VPLLRPQGQEADDASWPGVQLSYKRDSSRELTLLRLTCVLPLPVDVVASVYRDLQRRSQWDVKFHRGHVIAKLDEATDVAHLVFRSFSSPYKQRDMCLLRTAARLEPGGVILASRSVAHPNAPEAKENVRVVVAPSGLLLTPWDEDVPAPRFPLPEMIIPRLPGGSVVGGVGGTFAGQHRAAEDSGPQFSYADYYAMFQLAQPSSSPPPSGSNSPVRQPPVSACTLLTLVAQFVSRRGKKMGGWEGERGGYG